MTTKELDFSLSCSTICSRYNRVFKRSLNWLSTFKISGSRHSSYTSHQSRLSYTSHGDLLGGGKAQTKEAKLRNRSASRNHSVTSQPHAYPLPRQDSSLASRPLREYVCNFSFNVLSYNPIHRQCHIYLYNYLLSPPIILNTWKPLHDLQ